MRVARAGRAVQTPSHSPHVGAKIMVWDRQCDGMMPGIALDLKPFLRQDETEGKRFTGVERDGVKR